MEDKPNQEYPIEYSFKVVREPGIEPRIRDYQDKSRGGFISTTPIGAESREIVETCKNLSRLLNVEELNILIKGK
ncbi:MAG: hypothetical protein AABW67_00555 [Nanoarchaeota archaeon]